MKKTNPKAEKRTMEANAKFAILLPSTYQIVNPNGE
jgi:hypothetical protein